MKNIQSNTRQLNRAIRVRKRLLSRSDLPRLVVKRSLNHLHAQIVGDQGKVLAAASSLSLLTNSSDKTDKSHSFTKTDSARQVGVKLAELAKKNKVDAVVLDRGQYRFHGRVKALVEALKENGIKI